MNAKLLMKDLALPQGKPVRSVHMPRGLAPPGRRAATELLEMRKQEIERGTVTLAEIRTGAIELETCTSGAGIEPKTHHVFDPQRPVGLLVELEAVVFAAGEEV